MVNWVPRSHGVKISAVPARAIAIPSSCGRDTFLVCLAAIATSSVHNGVVALSMPPPAESISSSATAKSR